MTNCNSSSSPSLIVRNRVMSMFGFLLITVETVSIFCKTSQYLMGVVVNITLVAFTFLGISCSCVTFD